MANKIEASLSGRQLQDSRFDDKLFSQEVLQSVLRLQCHTLCRLVVKVMVQLATAQLLNYLANDAAGHLKNQVFTAAYASPELLPHCGETCLDTLLDKRCDVWALGVLVHHVFTSAMPGAPMAFHMAPEESTALPGVPEHEHYRDVLLRQQACWVSLGSLCYLHL